MNQTEILKRLEWSGILQEAFIHSATPCCPECRRIPDQGHTETCELNRLINQPPIDYPMVAGVSFRYEGPRETYILCSFYDSGGMWLDCSDAGEWEDRGNDFWFFRFNTQLEVDCQWKPLSDPPDNDRLVLTLRRFYDTDLIEENGYDDNEKWRLYDDLVIFWMERPLIPPQSLPKEKP